MSASTPWVNYTVAELSGFTCQRCRKAVAFYTRTPTEHDAAGARWVAWEAFHRGCRPTVASIASLVLKPKYVETIGAGLGFMRELLTELEAWGISGVSMAPINFQDCDPERVRELHLTAMSPVTHAVASALYAAAGARSSYDSHFEYLRSRGLAEGLAGLVCSLFGGYYDWRTATMLGLVVPNPADQAHEDESGERWEVPECNRPPAALIGKPFSELRNPFLPLLNVIACGLLPYSIAADGVIVLRPKAADEVQAGTVVASLA